MTVFVTGGTSFLGSHVVLKLHERGENVIAHYNSTPTTAILEDILDRIKCVQFNIIDLPCVMDTMKSYGVERIVHSAVVYDEARPWLAMEINVKGAINVFEAARLLDVKRVVYKLRRSL